MRNYMIFILAFLLFSSSCATTGQGKLKYIVLTSRDCSVCNRMLPVVDSVNGKFKSIVEADTLYENGNTGEVMVEKYKVKKYPANLFIGPDGELFYRYEGLLDERSVFEIINMELARKKISEEKK